MFSTDFIFRQQENLDNQKCQAGFRPLCNKILLLWSYLRLIGGLDCEENSKVSRDLAAKCFFEWK